MAVRKEIRLVPEQADALESVLESQRKYGRSIDISKPGAGKTVLALRAKQKLQEEYGNPADQRTIMLVIQPGEIQGTGDPSEAEESISPWERECAKYDETADYRSVTYQSLRIPSKTDATTDV